MFNLLDFHAKEFLQQASRSVGNYYAPGGIKMPFKNTSFLQDEQDTAKEERGRWVCPFLLSSHDIAESV